MAIPIRPPFLQCMAQRTARPAVVCAWSAMALPALAQVAITDPPVTHNFGNIAIGSTYATQYFSVFNQGQTAVTLGQVVVDGTDLVVCMALGCATVAPSDFVVSTGTGCSGMTLQPGVGCSTLVSFVPTAAGARLARLVVPVEGGNPVTRVVEGTGTSQPLDCVLDWAQQQYKDVLTTPTATFMSSPYYARCYQGGALCVGADTAVPTVAPANVYLYQNQTLQSLGLLSDFAALAKCQ